MCSAEFTFEGYGLTFLGISGYSTMLAEYDPHGGSAGSGR